MAKTQTNPNSLANLRPQKKGQAGLPGAGRPRKIQNRDIEDLALEKVQEWFGDAIEAELGGMDEMFRALIRRAFKDVNEKTGIAGNFHDTQLVFNYLFGKPVTRIESRHTNMVDMFKAMMNESADELESIIVDADSETVDDA